MITLDTDADGDGCSDAEEAGFTDANNDGQVDGTGIDANGLVTGGDAYGTPADTDSSGTADHLESGVAARLPDNDGDGIPDVTDLDDDNDGILDSDVSVRNSGPMQFDTLVDGGSNYTLAQTTIQLQTTGTMREDASDNDGNITLRGEDNSSVTITTNNHLISRYRRQLTI